jgi:hypothetical protein
MRCGGAGAGATCGPEKDASQREHQTTERNANNGGRSESLSATWAETVGPCPSHPLSHPPPLHKTVTLRISTRHLRLSSTLRFQRAAAAVLLPPQLSHVWEPTQKKRWHFRNIPRVGTWGRQSTFLPYTTDTDAEKRESLTAFSVLIGSSAPSTGDLVQHSPVLTLQSRACVRMDRALVRART